MRRRGTTICCSALALAIFCVQAAAAQLITVPIVPARPQWTLALNNGLTAPPGFEAARGYFPIEGERLVAYDLASGQQLWLVSAQLQWPPVPTDRLVFVVYPDAIAALDAGDGSETWRMPMNDRLAVRPVHHNGWLITATVSGTVAALRASDGQVVWKREAGARISAAAAVGAGRVYLPLEDRRVLALAMEDGMVLWERRLGGPPTGLLALDDRVYVGTTDNFLYCLAADRGNVAWRWRTGGDVVGTPVADDQRIYFVSLDNILRGLDRGGGSQEWKRALPLRPRGGPLLAGGTLIVGGLNTSIRGYLASSGAPAGDLTLPGDLAAAPHVFLDGGIPVLVAVTNDIVKGATVIGFTPAIGMPSAFSALPKQNPVPALSLP